MKECSSSPTALLSLLSLLTVPLLLLFTPSLHSLEIPCCPSLLPIPFAAVIVWWELHFDSHTHTQDKSCFPLPLDVGVHWKNADTSRINCFSGKNKWKTECRTCPSLSFIWHLNFKELSVCILSFYPSVPINEKEELDENLGDSVIKERVTLFFVLLRMIFRREPVNNLCPNVKCSLKRIVVYCLTQRISYRSSFHEKKIEEERRDNRQYMIKEGHTNGHPFHG